MSAITFPNSKSAGRYGVVCFSHLRWNFVFQRPQHLLERFAKRHDVLFIEEPIFYDGDAKFVMTDTKGRREGGGSASSARNRTG
jgi:UDP-galactopyranose mutase